MIPRMLFLCESSILKIRIIRFQEVRLEKLDALVVMQNPTAFEVYNETIRMLKAHCTRYAYLLDTGKREKKGGTTRLDQHRASLCLKSIEDILKRIKINGELPNNNYIRIAMIHAYQYLRKLRDLSEDVSRIICIYSNLKLFL